MIADYESIIIQSFEDTQDFFKYGFEEYTCQVASNGDVYEKYDIDGEREAAIFEFDSGFRRFDASYRAQRKEFLKELERTLIMNHRNHYEEYLASFNEEEGVRVNKEFSQEFVDSFNFLMGQCYTDSDGNENTFSDKFDEIANEYIE